VTLARRLTTTVHSSRPAQLTDMSLRERYPHDIAAVLNLRLAGFTVVDGEPRQRPRSLVLLASLALLPLAFAVVLQVFEPAPAQLVWQHFGWHLYFATLTCLVFLSSWIGCRIFYDLTSDLENALTPEGLQEYHRWADSRTRLGPQLAGAMLAGVLAMIALAVAVNVPGMSNRLYVNASSYASVFITAFTVAGAVYWIGHGTVLAYRLTRDGMMRLMWVAPARTPGLERLARCYRVAFYLAALGSAACLTPLLYWAYRGPQSDWLGAVKSGLLLVSFASTAAVAVLPQWWLSDVVSATRQATLAQLQSRLPPAADSVDLTDRELSTLQGLIKLASDSPQTTVSDRTIAALILGVTLSLAPNLVPFIK
jgi:hypothetical protein